MFINMEFNQYISFTLLDGTPVFLHFCLGLASDEEHYFCKPNVININLILGKIIKIFQEVTDRSCCKLL